MRFQALIPTMMENWPDALWDLALPRQEIDLLTDDKNCLLFTLSADQKYVVARHSQFSDDFRNDFSSLVEGFQFGTFLRLAGVSFKNPSRFLHPIFSFDDLLNLLRFENSRAAYCLNELTTIEFPVCLFLFPWHDILPWSEFRLFIRDRKLIGVSQHHHQEAYPEIQENLEAIKASLIPFSHQLIDALHMDTVVADVFIEQQGDGSFKTTLIELNPFIQRTDPCLYSWKNGGNFDGGIRYRKLRHNPYRNTTSAGRSAEPLELFREEDYRRH